jgi:hypothetical protein
MVNKGDAAVHRQKRLAPRMIVKYRSWGHYVCSAAGLTIPARECASGLGGEGPSSGRATRPSKPSGTSSLRVPTPVWVGTPSGCASWRGSMRGSRLSRVVSALLGAQPVRDDVSCPPLIYKKSNSSRRTRR